MKAKSVEEFQMFLAESGISVKESCGRFSYLTADRTKPITSRKLGDDYSKEAILEKNAENGKCEVLKRTPDEKANVSYFVPSKQPTADANNLERMISDKTESRSNLLILLSYDAPGLRKFFLLF